jgi:hypothetical protein
MRDRRQLGAVRDGELLRDARQRTLTVLENMLSSSPTSVFRPTVTALRARVLLVSETRRPVAEEFSA